MKTRHLTPSEIFINLVDDEVLKTAFVDYISKSLAYQDMDFAPDLAMVLGNRAAALEEILVEVKE